MIRKRKGVGTGSAFSFLETGYFIFSIESIGESDIILIILLSKNNIEYLNILNEKVK